jgi:hypothetical protein
VPPWFVVPPPLVIPLLAVVPPLLIVPPLLAPPPLLIVPPLLAPPPLLLIVPPLLVAPALLDVPPLAVVPPWFVVPPPLVPPPVVVPLLLLVPPALVFPPVPAVVVDVLLEPPVAPTVLWAPPATVCPPLPLVLPPVWALLLDPPSLPPEEPGEFEDEQPASSATSRTEPSPLNSFCNKLRDHSDSQCRSIADPFKGDRMLGSSERPLRRPSLLPAGGDRISPAIGCQFFFCAVAVRLANSLGPHPLQVPEVPVSENVKQCEAFFTKISLAWFLVLAYPPARRHR